MTSPTLEEANKIIAEFMGKKIRKGCTCKSLEGFWITNHGYIAEYRDNALWIDEYNSMTIYPDSLKRVSREHEWIYLGE